MKLRLLLVLSLAASLNGCFLWSSDTKGPKPFPLPVFQPATNLHVMWRGSSGSIGESMLRPAFSGGSVFAAGRDGALSRFDAAGREVWRIKTVPKLSGGVASDSNLVVVGSSDGELLAYDAEKGALRWRIRVGGEVLGTPFIADDLVVVRVGDNQLVAYNSVDGKRRWVYQRAQATLALRSYSGFARAGDMLFAGFPGGKLVALTLGGGFQRWEASIAQPKGSNELERMSDVVGDPIVRGDNICVGAFQGRVACVERETGNVRWNREYSSTVGVDADASAVYVTDVNGVVHAMDSKTGASFWKQDKLSYRNVGRPLIVGDMLAVSDIEGYLHLLDRKDGHFVARTRVDSSGISAPLLALPNNGIAVQAMDGTVYALSFKP